MWDDCQLDRRGMSTVSLDPVLPFQQPHLIARQLLAGGTFQTHFAPKSLRLTGLGNLSKVSFLFLVWTRSHHYRYRSLFDSLLCMSPCGLLETAKRLQTTIVQSNISYDFERNWWRRWYCAYQMGSRLSQCATYRWYCNWIASQLNWWSRVTCLYSRVWLK